MSLNWEAYWIFKMFFWRLIDCSVSFILHRNRLWFGLDYIGHWNEWRNDSIAARVKNKHRVDTNNTQHTCSHTIHMVTHKWLIYRLYLNLITFAQTANTSKILNLTDNQYIWDRKEKKFETDAGWQRPLCFIRCCNWRLTLGSWAGNIAIAITSSS